MTSSHSERPDPRVSRPDWLPGVCLAVLCAAAGFACDDAAAFPEEGVAFGPEMIVDAARREASRVGSGLAVVVGEPLDDARSEVDPEAFARALGIPYRRGGTPPRNRVPDETVLHPGRAAREGDTATVSIWVAVPSEATFSVATHTYRLGQQGLWVWAGRTDTGVFET